MSVITKMNRLLFLGTLVVSALSCPTREKALTCFYDKADLNGDGRISRHEMRRAIDHYLPWWQRIPFKTFGGIDKVLSDCDANGDGYLTKDEARQLKNTCLNSCFKRSHTVSTFGC